MAALLRIAEADGEIFIDGISIKGLQLQESVSQCECVSVLSQSPVLLSGTIRKTLILWISTETTSYGTPLNK